ncbi:MAG: hypothetical protein R3B82_27135 [Sandaracinaceae bacterium]
MYRLIVLALGTSLALPSVAAAQAAIPLDPPTVQLTVEPAEPSTHPDEGLMIAGGVTFLVAYAAALAINLPEIAAHCGRPDIHGYTPPCEYIGLQMIPLAHPRFDGLGMFSNPIFIITELVGALIFVGGAAHHHPDEPLAEAELRVTPTSVTVGF